MKIKDAKGIVGTDLSIAIIIIIVFVAIITTLLYQIAKANIRTARYAIATNYAVNVLEQIALIPYEELTENLDEEWCETKGIHIESPYHVKIEQKADGEKEDLVKEITVTVSYPNKEITITTLKKSHSQ